MKNKPFAVLAMAVGLLMVSGTMFAHHSGSVYDAEHLVTLKGTVTAFKFINPHVQIHFEVKDENGNVVKWVALSAPLQRMYRAGWNRNTLKPGNQVTVIGAPAKNGRKVMGLWKLVGPGGLVLTEKDD